MDFDDEDSPRSPAPRSRAPPTSATGARFNDDSFLDIQNEPHIVDPDEEFEGECCFWLMKLLRGYNVGRRLKRKVFKYAVMNFMVGFSMLIITGYEGRRVLSVHVSLSRLCSLFRCLWC